ncbi:MAG: hypothetical protein KatS3mg096_726 [Candidatus Parcubacteria bacterium]|nr:MAG: hypothetical protein KatS3mg096_726 [Candidatus Parcubacteria bacterium]
MSDLEKIFLQQQGSGFLRLSLDMKGENKKEWLNLKYLAGRTVDVLNPQTQEKEKAILYLFKDENNGDYLTCLTRSLSLINSLIPINQGNVFNIRGIKTKIGEKWKISYSVEFVKKEELSSLDKSKIEIFLKYKKDEPNRRGFFEKTQKENSGNFFDS